MLKLPLEEQLESRLRALGMELHPRVYGEDIRRQAGLDDRTGCTYGGEELQARRSPLGLSRLWALLFPGHTAAQEMQGSGVVPFFLRRSDKRSGLVVTYEVYAAEPRECYRGVADELIRKRDSGIFGEYVKVHERDPKDQIAGISATQDTQGRIEIFLVKKAVDEWCRSHGRSAPEILAQFRRLQGQLYDPALIAGAATAFFHEGRK